MATAAGTRQRSKKSKETARRAAKSPPVHVLARAGIAARGVLYLIVAVLAWRVAVGDHSEPSDRNGALLAVARQPLGGALLVALALGFAGYAVWRAAQAVAGVDEDEAAKQWVLRLAAVGKGVIYLVLCVTAVEFVLGRGHAGEGPEHDVTARVLSWPAGRWIVAAAGVALVATCIANLVQGVGGSYRKQLRTGKLSAGARRAVAIVAGVGLTARAVVFALLGIFVVRAALRYDAREAVGLDGALHRLGTEPHGPLLIGLVAIGLAVYGIYALIQARYRELFVP